MASQFEPTAGEEEIKTPEGSDGAQDASDTKVDQAEPVEGAESNPDGGAEAGEAGKDGGEEAGEVGKAEVEPTDVVAQMTTLKEEILRELRGGDKEPISAPEDVLKQVTLPQFDENTLATIEQKFGIGEEVSPMFRSVAPVFTTLMNHMAGNIVKHFQGQFAGLQYEKALEGLSKEKGFEDVPALRKGIDEFLNDFSPVHRANPALIKKGVIYARGLNAKAQVRAAAQGAERQTKIIGKTKPAGVTGGKASGTGVRLSPAQESAANLYPGGRGAYIKHLQARNFGMSFEPAAK